MTTLACDRIFSVGDYVSEELEAREWSHAFAAARAKGDLDTNTLWLQFICCRPLWWDKAIDFSQHEAEQLARIFGTSSDLFMNIHKHFAEEKAKLSDEEITASFNALLEDEV